MELKKLRVKGVETKMSNKLCYKKITSNEKPKGIFTEYHNTQIKAHKSLHTKLNKDLMRLISEMRTEPLYHDYYKAKEAVLSIMTVEIEHKGNELIGYWRPKTIEEIGDDAE